MKLKEMIQRDPTCCLLSFPCRTLVHITARILTLIQLTHLIHMSPVLLVLICMCVYFILFNFTTLIGLVTTTWQDTEAVLSSQRSLLLPFNPSPCLLSYSLKPSNMFSISTLMLFQGCYINCNCRVCNIWGLIIFDSAKFFCDLSKLLRVWRVCSFLIAE